jgi:hypothetical protein
MRFFAAGTSFFADKKADLATRYFARSAGTAFQSEKRSARSQGAELT